MPETLELTDREKAIAAGDEVPEEDTVVEENTPDTEDSPPEDPENKDEHDAGAGADAGSEHEEPADEEVGEPEAGKDADDASWIDDDARELAASYGLDEEDLQRFGSAEQFEAAAVLFDKQLSKKPDTKIPDADEGGKEADGKAAKDGGQEADLSKVSDDEILDVEKFKEAGYGPDEIKLIESHNRMVEDRKALRAELDDVKSFVEEQRKAVQEQSQAAVINDFHDAVDTLDKGTFGRSLDDGGAEVDLSKGHTKNRERLFGAVETIVRGIVAKAEDRGKEPNLPSMKVLVKRAAALEFGDEIRNRNVRTQSSRRRAAGTRRAPKEVPDKKQETGDSKADETERLLSNPELIAEYDRLTQENGTS